MLTRREFVEIGAALGAGMMLPLGMAEKAVAFLLQSQPLPANPKRLTRFTERLPMFGVMPSTGTDTAGNVLFDVGAHQLQTRVHTLMAPTTAWGYRPSSWTPGGVEPYWFGPAFAFERGTRARVTWHNNLTGVRHPMPIDPSIHWAAPTGGGTVHLPDGRDLPMVNNMPGPYTDAAGLPTWVNPTTLVVDADSRLDAVPLTPHVHGGEQPPGSDGGPDTWWTPGFSAVGPGFQYAGDGVPGANNIYSYNNTQPPASIWYHDHALGLTRLNVYMGLAGGYLIHDAAKEPAGLPNVFDWVADQTTGVTQDKFGNPYDHPIILQDRIFDVSDQLWYPAVSLNPASHPFWVPEFFGDTMVVNGKAWPKMDVEPRKYRFRLWNGSNARFYELFLWDTVAKLPGPALVQIATDGGYLGKPVTLDPAIGGKILLAPGERAEVVVDFANFKGRSLTLRNTAKAPFPGGAPADPQTVGEIMRFVVDPTAVTDTSSVPIVLNSDLVTSAGAVDFPSIPDAPVMVRSLTLNELMGAGGPLEVVLNFSMWPHPDPFDPVHMPTTELPKLGTTEVWEIINTTADVHPIHLHLVQFQLLGRQPYQANKYMAAYTAAFAQMGGMLPMDPMGPPYTYDGFLPNYGQAAGLTKYTRTLTIRGVSYTLPVVGGNPDVTPFLQKTMAPPRPNEQGWKDTVQMNPGEITRILVRFAPIDGTRTETTVYPFTATGRPGYVWHCHIIDHEDNEMMRPYEVQP